MIRCIRCGYSLNEGAAVCPQCEAVIMDPAGLKRKAENRPAAEDKTQIISRNYNGTHIVKQLSDGSFVCTCASFLLQQGTQNGNTPYTTCKHIREYLEQNTAPEYTGKAPSDWQMFLLRTLGTGVEHLSNAQAYYLVSELLTLRGISYPELIWFLKRQKKPNLLPLIPFGVEIEGGIRSKTIYEQRLMAAGFPVYQTGYTGSTRGANEWRISQDGSVQAASGFAPMELVTPKLMGDRGLQQLKKALEIWNDVGASHNQSCGVHVHLDAYGTDTDFKRRLAFNYAKAERQYLWFLVAPSRRQNRYCKPVDSVFFTDLETNLAGRGNSENRYYALNFNSLLRHSTIEVRLMHCTTDPLKVSAWTILLLRFYEATKNGLDHRQIPDNDFTGFLAAIGFNDSACSALQRAKSHLVERFNYWKKDAAEHPDHVPALPALPLNNMANIEQIRALEEEIGNIETFLEVEPGRRYRYYATPSASTLTPRNLRTLAQGNTQRTVDIETITSTQHDDGTARLVVEGRIVTWNPAEDTLTCTCSYARHNDNRCYHVRWAARYLLNCILAGRLEAARAELAALTGETPATAPAATATENEQTEQFQEVANV